MPKTFNNTNSLSGVSSNVGRSASEEALVGVWAEVLRLPEGKGVETDANFFDIGGDSMKAMEVIIRAGEVLGIQLPLMAFFEDPTIAHLAAVVDELREPDTQVTLSKIWSEVLGLPDVAAGANFFDIGGDSMKAMEVIARANKVFGVGLPLMAFFEDPTLTHLASVIDQLKRSSSAAQIERVCGRREFPLSYSQQVFWLLAQQNRGTGLYNTARIFRVRGPVDSVILERSLNELRLRHEILQVRFVSGIDWPVQVVDAGAALHLEVSDVSALDVDAAERAAFGLALETVREPFDLEAGPVLRTRLVRLSAKEFLLCMAIHHVVSDGFTGSILLEELAAIYDAFMAGQANPLPKLDLHFTDYAAWEREWMTGPRLDGELEYWCGALQGAEPSIDLPVDGERSSESDRRGHLKTATMSIETLQRLQALAQSNGTTLFTILLAGFRILLHRWSGQRDFTIGTIASNRSRRHTERMIGCFVNPLPLRNAVTEGESVLALVRAEKKAVMEAFSHQDCPFAKIVEAVNPERTSGDNPLFNVALLLQSFPTIAVIGHCFQAEDINFDAQVALLDLRFIATESAAGLQVDCEYSTSLLKSATIDDLLASYESVLMQMVDAPESEIAQIEISDNLVRSGAAHRKAKNRQTIAIAANFTAEPVEDALAFWMGQLRMPSRIEFAPFDQVFQQLLDPGSLLGSNSDGVNIVFIQWRDGQALGDQARELAAALKTNAARRKAPILVCICPPEVSGEEQVLATELAGHAGIHVVYPRHILKLYPVENYRDTFADELGAIPYNAEFFVALGSMVARRMYALRSTPYKVIALDCDDMLWKGVRSEQRPVGVEVDAHRRGLQEFVLAQRDAGMLLCLTSKNAEEYVEAAFQSNSGMLLSMDDFVVSRIDLQSKSEHLKDFASALGMELDSFILIGGDPLEGAEVRENCPGVLVLDLPVDESAISDILRQVWAFDHWNWNLTGDMSLPLVPHADLERIAKDLGGVEAIARAIQSRSRTARVETSSGQMRNATEEILAGIWARVLHIPAPGINDDFFRLGGNSLLAVQVLSRVRQALGVEIPLRAMFESPTLAGFARRMDAGRRVQTGAIAPKLVKIARAGTVRASFAQQRLWFLDQLEPENPIYNIPQMILMRGPLNVDALQRSLSEIVRRHEALRTTFEAADGEPVQNVGAAFDVALPVTDLSHLPEVQRETEMRRLGLQEAVRPFDLAQSLMLRARLLRRAPEDHVLLIVLHHIAGDRWSAGILAEEMEALYSAYVRDEPSPLQEPPVQYADFSEWQRGWLQGAELEKQAAYWRQQLTGAPAVLELPSDRPRPAVLSHKGRTETGLLPQDLVDKLTALSQGEGVTLFMTLLAAFQVLLGRYSGQEDIVVGSPIAGRNVAEVERLIGFFVNTLALRTDLSGDPNFRGLLQRVRGVALNAYAHQDIPFERLVEELQPERSLSYQPIFQVLFALQNAPQRSLELAGLHLERVPLHQGTSAFDMSWFATHVANGMQVRVEYNTDLFDVATITRAMSHFGLLLEEIVAHPDTSLSELKFLGEQEREQILKEFNATAADYPRDLCIHDLVTQQAHRTPNAFALVDGERRVSYAELNARANQIAHFLIKRGAGPDVLIGICGPRTADLLVGILGILKSGSAYVPLDPNYPSERLGNILEDAQVPLVLSLGPTAGVLPEFWGETIHLDTAWPEMALEPEVDPVTAVKPEHLGYVLFTSGSTGRPKGVALEHRSAATLIHWAKGVFTPAELEGVLLSTSVCFDLSVFEIFVTLSAGGKVIIAENALYLPTLAARNEVTLINSVPSAIAELLRMEGVPTSVMTVNLAGEALPAEIVERIYASTRVERIYNLYGPTEDTTYSTFTLVPRGAAVTIGRPLANTQCYVLDANLKPAPIGMPGELYIAGEGLARGYYGRPEMTAERFLRNPFSCEPGARMYRTGDRSRWLANGELQYLGRLDSQVKLRGFRIELGEIEATLDRHPGVERSIVMVREDNPGMPQLVAYVVATPGETPAAEKLQNHVMLSLPKFMTPTAIVMLVAFPVTANGKVDRKALPAPDSSAMRAEYIAPRNPTEQGLVDILSEVLHVERVGVTDNFFALGGHSLLATQVIARVRRVLNAELPLRAIFEAPTVEDLAKRIPAAAHSAQLAAIPHAPRDRPLPLSFAQERLWFLHQLDPANPHYNVPRLQRMRGRLDADALQRGLNEVVRRHEVLRTTFSIRDDNPVQVIRPVAALPIEVIDFSHLPEQKREAEWRRFGEEESRRPFNLETGPLLRPFLIRLAEDDHVFMINMHHITTERWSQGLLWSELSALYIAFTEGRPSPLGDLPIQYADYAVWQREWLRGEELDRQVAYWRDHLANATPLELTTDHPRPQLPKHRGSATRRELSPVLVARLNVFSREENATLFMTMLAVFKTLLMRYTEQDDIVIGTVIAGRTQAELEHLIGFFVNALVLRTDLSGDPSFRELVGRIKETTLGAYTHQDVPFEKLVEELNPQRSLNRNPFFQVAFVHDQVIKELALPGLEVEGSLLHQGSSVFDLNWSVVEHPEGIRIYIEYDVDLFEADTIERMLNHYVLLLETATTLPLTAISRLPLLTAAEERQQMLEWNHPGAAYPVFTIPERFEEQAECTPESMALIFENREMSYGELNRRANQLAHHLRSLGVRPETLVGICIERSLEMLVGILGILKAGGAYVPVDPAYPTERQAFMLEDARVAVLVTQEALAGGLHTPRGATLCMDSDWGLIAQQPDYNPERLAQPGNTAYVIYTSGTTGRPKGVMITHANVARLFTATDESFSFSGADTWTLFHSFAFDFSVWEIWGALLYGGHLVVVPRLTAQSPDQFHELLIQHKVTVLNQTPSAFRQLISADERSERSCELALRLVIFGGEALEFKTLLPWTLRHGDTPSLINMYGITETTVHVTYYKVTAAEVAASATSVVGVPIPDLQLYILDRNRRLLPAGATGEIYVGGGGVAKEYLNRPALTAERFFPNPFSPEPNARLYKTGDLGRFLPDGNIQHMGRTDNQVKIRGFRIELGEIENTLRRQSAVSDCVVIAREDQPGDKRLVAYIVASPGSRPDIAGIRAHLGGSLPEYMVPAAMVLLEELPLTSSGKIDTKALPTPDYAAGQSNIDGGAPETAVQQIVAAIWSEVLKLDRIALGNDFFQIGGHSLLAAQVLARVRNAFNVDIAMRAIFEHSTLGAFAQEIEEARAGSSPLRPPLTRVSRDSALPPSFAQQRMWIVQQLNPQGTTYNMPTAVKLIGVLDVPALEHAFNELVRRHEVLRTVFTVQDDSLVQIILPHRPFALPVVSVDALPESDRAAAAEGLFAQESALPFDLAAGPMFRFKLVRVSAAEHVLITVLHHINTDGWSNAVIARELSELYSAALEGRDAQLPELAIQYVDYTVWQREFLSGENLARQLDFWRDVLAGAPDVLALPTDRERPVEAESGAWAAFHNEDFSPELTARIAAFAQQHAATPFMVLASAYYWLLAKLSGQLDIVIGTDLANRPTVVTERLIGFFVNVLPVRAHINAHVSFADFLRGNREAMLDAFAHQEIPFDKLVQELRPERSNSYNPLVQVLFVMQNLPRNALELPGIVTTNLQSRFKARFDLSLFVTPGEATRVSWMYNTALFELATAQRFASLYRELVVLVLEHPTMTFEAALERLAALERAEIESAQRELKEAFADKLKTTRRRSGVVIE